MTSAKLLLYTATLLYLSATASLLAEAQSCGGFLALCRAPFDHSDGFLKATCETPDGSWALTGVDLNQHIGNENGVLVDGAGYRDTCHKMGFVHDGGSFSVTAACQYAFQGHGSPYHYGPVTSYDVNSKLSYKDQQLVFDKC